MFLNLIGYNNQITRTLLMGTLDGFWTFETAINSKILNFFIK
jgi:hypothetical protein